MTEPKLDSDDSEDPFEEFDRRLNRLEQVRQTALMREMGLFQPPLRNSGSVRALMEFELTRWSPEQRDLVTPYLLDTPHFHVREWDYAGLDTPPRELYLPCWAVAYFPQKQLSVVYCDNGHGRTWGALEQDGMCSVDAVWNNSIKEAIWRFRMLDGFAPGEQDLDDWIGPVRKLTRDELEQVNHLVVSSVKDPSALEGQLEKVWTYYTARVERGESKPAFYLFEILTGVLRRAPVDMQGEWEERVRSHEPKPLG